MRDTGVETGPESGNRARGRGAVVPGRGMALMQAEARASRPSGRVPGRRLSRDHQRPGLDPTRESAGVCVGAPGQCALPPAYRAVRACGTGSDRKGAPRDLSLGPAHLHLWCAGSPQQFRSYPDPRSVGHACRPGVVRRPDLAGVVAGPPQSVSLGLIPCILLSPTTRSSRYPCCTFCSRAGSKPAAARSCWLTGTFLGCYLLFLAVPVAGPYYDFPRPDPVITGQSNGQASLCDTCPGSSYGAAFPSSHVAAALVATAAGFLGVRWIGWVLTVPSILLCIGVVYCQMHYGVDALAGGAVALLVIGSGWWAERGREGTNRGPRRGVAPHTRSSILKTSVLSPDSSSHPTER